jgi:16S rRNA (guanine966-N2)-methyltransferase
MRIIGGIAAGRILRAPKGLEVRPTPDLVRQAIFNSLGVRVGGARVLDLFAGTAALGLECLSRGAAFVLSIEKSAKHAGFIRQNLEVAALPKERHQVRVHDVFGMLAQLAAAGERFDLVFADPPYGEKNLARRSTSLAQRLLDDAHLPALLSAQGLFILGHARRDTLDPPPVWEEVKALKHGDSIMRFLKARGEAMA